MTISPDELVAELNALGVRLLTGGSTPRTIRTLPPADLLAALASSSEARLRLAVIPLLLVRAEYSVAAPQLASMLGNGPLLAFKCFYTAAVLLQHKYFTVLSPFLDSQVPLPDFFSAELDLPQTDNLDAQLRTLGERHREYSGLDAAWPAHTSMRPGG